MQFNHNMHYLVHIKNSTLHSPLKVLRRQVLTMLSPVSHVLYDAQRRVLMRIGDAHGIVSHSCAKLHLQTPLDCRDRRVISSGE